MDFHPPSLGLDPDSSLLLFEIGEPSANDLRIVVVEAKAQSRLVDTEFGPAQPVEPDATSRAFEFTWWNYVAYSVRNESYWKLETGELVGAGRFGTRSESAFLAYVSASTFATDDYPGSLTHWFLNTEWHCVDVVSNTRPDVRELAQEEVQERTQVTRPV